MDCGAKAYTTHFDIFTEHLDLGMYSRINHSPSIILMTVVDNDIANSFVHQLPLREGEVALLSSSTIVI